MSPGPWFSGAPRTFLLCGSTVALLACLLGPPWRAVVFLVRPFFVFIIIIIIIREYGSTLYVGMTRGKNGGRIKRVH